MSAPSARVISGLLWVLVVSGPLLGGLALLRPAGSPAGPAAAPTAPAAVTGLAELAVRAHLAALPADVPAAVAPGHTALRADEGALEGLTPAQRVTAARSVGTDVHVAVLAVEPAGPGRWGVTVGAVRDGRVEAWLVTVAAAADGPVVETFPALVGLPARGTPPTPLLPGLRAPEPENPVHAAVDGFLTAMLTGEGDLARYTAAGTTVAVPAPSAAADLRRIAAAPLSGGRATALAEVRLRRADGAVHLLHYPLLLQPSGGRWEVVRVLPALPLTSTR